MYKAISRIRSIVQVADKVSTLFPGSRGRMGLEAIYPVYTGVEGLHTRQSGNIFTLGELSYQKCWLAHGWFHLGRCWRVSRYSERQHCRVRTCTTAWARIQNDFVLGGNGDELFVDKDVIFNHAGKICFFGFNARPSKWEKTGRFNCQVMASVSVSFVKSCLR